MDTMQRTLRKIIGIRERAQRVARVHGQPVETRSFHAAAKADNECLEAPLKILCRNLDYGGGNQTEDGQAQRPRDPRSSSRENKRSKQRIKSEYTKDHLSPSTSAGLTQSKSKLQQRFHQGTRPADPNFHLQRPLSGRDMVGISAGASLDSMRGSGSEDRVACGPGTSRDQARGTEDCPARAALMPRRPCPRSEGRARWVGPGGGKLSPGSWVWVCGGSKQGRQGMGCLPSSGR